MTNTGRAVAVALLLAAGFLAGYGLRGYTEPPEDAITAAYMANLRVFQQRVLMDLPDSAIPVYGDSHIQGLALQRADSRLVNFGIGHDRVGTLAERVREGASQRRFSTYVVAVGINDLMHGASSADVVGPIKSLISDLPFARRLIIGSVLPVARTRPGAEAINERVRDVNESLSALAATRARVTYLNSYEVLADDEGYLPSRYHLGDGLHLNSEANRLWLRQLAQALDGAEAMAQ
ncbi:GDSL-type esterase/lipase family protein [Marinobacter sp. C2H3]|uniref:GDSL-type esterase/lipase family protein n=1 Tax=Marinobacter sp. C2H3 TaxID=3119003 RepID=UPI00300F71C5